MLILKPNIYCAPHRGEYLDCAPRIIGENSNVRDVQVELHGALANLECKCPERIL